MQCVNGHHRWRPNFLEALRLLGSAAARLPYGVPDPTLQGTAAVELYTGGLCSALAIDVGAPKARAFNTELLAMGFRWTERPPRGARGLWHPELAIGVDIEAERCALTAAEQTNVLTVVLNAAGQDLPDAAGPLLRVIGIEDLIAAEIARWLEEGARTGEASALIRVLIELGLAGVGGRFRVNYLQRRLAYETGGEVTLDLPRSADEIDTRPRAAHLVDLHAVIALWRAKAGFSFDLVGSVRTRSRTRRVVAHQRSDVTRPDSRGIVSSATIVSLDTGSLHLLGQP